MGAVRIQVGAAAIEGELTLPGGAAGVVLFAHGSGSSRFSPRNRFVGEALHSAGFGSLLIDLLTTAEEEEDARTGALRFDIGLLAERLGGALRWLGGEPSTASLAVGLFGASTGAAAALVTAARNPAAVAAVVSRGGRPDLAGASLAAVQAPTLLIVGGEDTVVLELNERAQQQLGGSSALEVVAGAGHLFEEPGALVDVARLAAGWFMQHLRRAGRGPAPPP